MTKFITLDQIREIEFGITSLCNAGCPLCARHIHGTSIFKEHLGLNSVDFELFKKITHDLGTQVQNIEAKFGGTIGDIVMHPQAEQILDYAMHHYKEVDIDTNGGIGSKHFWNKLGGYAPLGFDQYGIKCHFSIDGLSDTHSIYRINTSYERVIENAQTFIDAGGYAIWKFIIFEHNQHQVDEAREIAKTMGFKGFDAVPSNRFRLPATPVQAENYKAKINKGIDQQVKDRGSVIKPGTVTFTNNTQSNK